MRELIWTGFVSVDGVADSPGGVSEGHSGGGWVFQTDFVPEAFSLKGEELEETTALLFGRSSYEAFSSFWPASPEHEPYRDLPKFVVSSTLGDDDLIEGWGETHVLASLDDVAALKDGDGGPIFIHGSVGLAFDLAHAGLIDRYNLLVFPVLLGAGKSVFVRGDEHQQKLRLRESEVYANGVIKAVYEVVR